jgi:glutamate formiminotransferase
MTWMAIPNVSEGRDKRRITAMKKAIESTGVRVLDVHSDGVHHRSVFTVTGNPDVLPQAMASLASACEYIDLTHHRGVHPRLGRLDVCPIVPLDESMQAAIAVANHTGRAIHERIGLPIYFYGKAASRDSARELPNLRKGGLKALRERALTDLPPDIGGPEIELRAGVVCVGVRGVLIAFNVWLRCDQATAETIAHRVRSSGGGPPGVRALGLKIDAEPTSQVSMNLIDPATTGIDAAFRFVSMEAARVGCPVIATEIVGLVPERYLPDPDAQAARLLIKPGRSVESAAS